MGGQWQYCFLVSSITHWARARAIGTVPKVCPKFEILSLIGVPTDISAFAHGLVPKLCPTSFMDVPIRVVSVPKHSCILS